MKKTLKKLGMSVALALGVLVTMPMECQAEELKLGKGVSGIVGDDLRATYDFTLPSSGCVSFTYTYNESGNNRFFIYDEAGNELYARQTSDGTYSDSLHLLKGNYKLTVKQYIGEPVLKYSVISSFKPSNETVSESYMSLNNDVISATTYKNGKTFKGQLAVNDKTDIYKMKLQKNSFVNLTVYNELKNIEFNIVNSMGDIKYNERNIAPGKRTYSYFLPKGTYYVTFSGEETGNYSFKTVSKELSPVALKKLTNVKTKSAKVTWKRETKVDGYVLQYSTSKNFKKGRKSININTASQSSVKLTKLKKNQKYYVRIKTYKEAENGKIYYSAWSKAKTVTIKK